MSWSLGLRIAPTLAWRGQVGQGGGSGGGCADISEQVVWVLGQGWGRSCPLQAPPSMTGDQRVAPCHSHALAVSLLWPSPTGSASQAQNQQSQGASRLLLVAAGGHKRPGLLGTTWFPWGIHHFALLPPEGARVRGWLAGSQQSCGTGVCGGVPLGGGGVDCCLLSSESVVRKPA